MTLLNTILKPMKHKTDSNTGSGYSGIFIYESELDYISRCILDYPAIETGGNLFGHYTKNGIPVIEYVIGPGMSAVHHATRFQQEESYLKNIYGYISGAFALSETGAWHSHHQLDLPHPSSGDVGTVIKGLEKTGLDEFIIVIGSFTPPQTPINAFVFANNPMQPYRPVEWHILKGMSPFREKIEEICGDILLHPKTLKGEYAKKNRHLFEKQHWLSDKKNIEELKTVVNFIRQKTEHVKVFHPEGQIVIDIQLPDKNMHVMIPDTFLQDLSYTIKINNTEGALIDEENCTADMLNGISTSIIQHIKDKI
ncbi:MAG: hypothetical protein LBL07_14505 [Tannerella sp.]|jgi:hypothetical protein|nr:hypothetical protein [Tannerella sp.]